MNSTITIQATYRGGLLEPLHPLPFREGEDLQLTVTRKSALPKTKPALILAEIAKLPTAGGDPNSGDDHDRHLYGTLEAS